MLLRDNLTVTLFCFDFQLKEIPTTNNIGTISAINTYQMIAIKAKLLQKGDKNKVKTDDGEKFLVNAYLGDPSGTIKVTLWDRFCDLEEGKTYPFDNHLVRGEYKTQDIILVTPKTGCKAVENTPFKENLNYPSHLQQLLHLQKYYNTIIPEKSTVITCNACGLEQKVKSTTRQCHIQFYIEVNATEITGTLFHDIKNLLISKGKQDLLMKEDNISLP